MKVEGGVHQLDKVIEGKELISHARLVAEKVSLHALHEANKAPECNGIILLHGIDWR